MNTANAVKIVERYDLSAAQLQELYEMTGKNVFAALTAAFRFGYSMGSRATLANIKQKRMNNM